MSVDELNSEFKKARPLYKAYTASLDSLIRVLAENFSIETFSIEKRTKELDSFSEKINREGKSGKYNSIGDITDIAGIRVISYLQEDCDKMCRVIEDSFEIDYNNSVKKEDELDPDKFGYLSTHYIVSLPASRLKLPEYSRFSDLKAEIQVRTLLQHTWAAIDWKFRYKEEREAPKQLRRRLFRISALLEAADNEFSAVKCEIDEISKEYSDKIKNSDLRISIDTESLLSYIETSRTATTVFQAARDAGIRVSTKADMSGALSLLAGTARVLGLDTLSDLDGRLAQHQDQLVEFFKYVIENGKWNESKTSFQLLKPAVLRYALIPTGENKSIGEILQKFPPSSGYGEAIKSFKYS